METRSLKRSLSCLLLTALAAASALPAQGNSEGKMGRREYLPSAICAQLGGVRAKVLGADGQLYLMLSPRLSGPKGPALLREEMEKRSVPKELVDALTDTAGPETTVTRLGDCAKNVVKVFLEQFLDNVVAIETIEALETLEAISRRTPEEERRKVLLVTVDAGLQTDAKGQCEAVISLRLVRLQISPAKDGGAQQSVDEGGELLFADRAFAPLESNPEKPLDACRRALKDGILEIAAGLFGWERMVAVDWRKAHAATLGSGLNAPMVAAKEPK